MSELEKFGIVMGALGAFIVLCLLVWACIAIRRVIESRRRTLAEEEIPILEPEEEVTPDVEETQTRTLKFVEGIFPVPVRVGEGLAEGKVRKVFDLKLVEDYLPCVEFDDTPNDPKKQHRGVIFAVPHPMCSWSESSRVLDSRLVWHALGVPESALEVPQESVEELVYAMPGDYGITGCECLSAKCIRMRFPVGSDVASTGWKDKLKEEMKKSFRALFDTLVASTRTADTALFLAVADLCSVPEALVPYRAAYAAALKEVVEETVAKLCAPSTDSTPSCLPLFQDKLGISCVYVCDPNYYPSEMLELLTEVPQFVPVCGTAMDSASFDAKGAGKSGAVS